MVDSLARLRRSFAAFSNWYAKDSGNVIKCYNYQPGDAISVDDWLNSMVDEVEKEIKEKYMLLPVDADGVPIHVGDKMQYHGGEPFTVCAVAPGVIHVWAVVKLGERMTTYDYAPSQCTHYKPRTLEDVLLDAIERAAHPENEWSEIIADCADELRSMGVGE